MLHCDQCLEHLLICFLRVWSSGSESNQRKDSADLEIQIHSLFLGHFGYI
ncbi:hypothetical protein EXN66_Car017314 [Channa argus]|uniref:Uncharacterized protein n=1 Tax=Channa argus TaxID=215402 RepID=A0A6G1QHQ4_CHAAH|nr:hypothetical protein EXN66_Car017314 [Channa argus]